MPKVREEVSDLNFSSHLSIDQLEQMVSLQQRERMLELIKEGTRAAANVLTCKHLCACCTKSYAAQQFNRAAGIADQLTILHEEVEALIAIDQVIAEKYARFLRFYQGARNKIQTAESPHASNIDSTNAR